MLRAILLMQIAFSPALYPREHLTYPDYLCSVQHCIHLEHLTYPDYLGSVYRNYF